MDVTRRFVVVVLAFVALVPVLGITPAAQAPALQPVTVGSPMPDLAGGKS